MTDPEAALLGAVIRRPALMETLWGRAEPAWFTQPTLRALWSALEALWGEGRGLGLAGAVEAWDHFTVRDETLARHSIDAERFDETVVELRDQPPVGVDGVVVALERAAYRRRITQVAGELRVLADADDLDLDGLASQAEQHTAGLTVQASRSAGVWLEEFIGQADSDDPWVIPGMMRRGWRSIVVASEGGGKSTLLAQCAVAASHGVHPLAFTPIAPQPVLLVDLENPRSVIRRRLRQLHGLNRCGHTPQFRLLPEPGGLDLRRPRARAMLEAELRLVRPSLVVLGPLYKAYSRQGRESDEEAVMATQHVLDALRTRYGFALMIEHHAPHGDGYKREMRPIGSSAWLRWPELGIGMERDPDRAGSVRLTRWRGDRSTNNWPTHLDRDTRWPWAGRWPKGSTMTDEEQP